jgi:hypothetical protein
MINKRVSNKGEENRVKILEFMKGKQVTSNDIINALDMPRQKVANYLQVLQRSGHVVSVTINSRFLYKRTNKKFITIAMQDKMLGDDTDLDIVEPTVPHARIVKLLSNPLPPPPAPKRRSSMYGGIQSGLSKFGLE